MLASLRRVCVAEQPEVVLADPGYWHTAQMKAIQDHRTEILAPPAGRCAPGSDRGGKAALVNRCATCVRPTAATSSTDSTSAR